jgi:hypothetical protein
VRSHNSAAKANAEADQQRGDNKQARPYTPLTWRYVGTTATAAAA